MCGTKILRCGAKKNFARFVRHTKSASKLFPLSVFKLQLGQGCAGQPLQPPGHLPCSLQRASSAGQAADCPAYVYRAGHSTGSRLLVGQPSSPESQQIRPGHIIQP